jgi:hypothetical protein
MRSDLVFRAMTHVPNRFLLANVLARASRGFHKLGTRIQDTTNAVLVRFGHANPIADEYSVRACANDSRRHSRPQLVIRRKKSNPHGSRSTGNPAHANCGFRGLGARSTRTINCIASLLRTEVGFNTIDVWTCKKCMERICSKQST